MNEQKAALDRANRLARERRNRVPIDWVRWPSGKISLAFKCGHVITRDPEGDDDSMGTGKTCAQCIAERKERIKAAAEGLQ